MFKHPERLLAAVSAQKPDIIGLANYGWNENLNLQVGRYLRQILPSALIVIGGPNIDPEPDLRRSMLLRHSYADFSVVDGGEEPFSELIGWWRDDRENTDNLPQNLLWLADGEVRETTERPLKKIIENIPSPYLSGFLDEFLISDLVPLFETNRGCPFKCTFCAWGMASKDLVRRFDLETALAEIEYVGARSKARNWIICDANFGILKRDVEIARAIRSVKDREGTPEICQIWLAKNVTDRNLEIGEILRDMIVPVMAVQSLDEEVLRHIKRDNISLDTYAKYQEKFHAIGSTTYSDVIVPLPGETLQSHLDGLRKLFTAGVDVIQNHNMRMLAGAETNSTETRQAFGFQTRYRLIHGDAGVYRSPDGGQVRAFEVEESLRSTTTLSEEDVFWLRKLHFLVDFCWNIEVYKTLLTHGQDHGANPLDVLLALLDPHESEEEVRIFWAEFETASQSEWFDTEEDIREYFAEETNFRRLIDQEFDKLNIKFSVRILEKYKEAFDSHVLGVLRSWDSIPGEQLDQVAGVAFAMFPPLDEDRPEIVLNDVAATPHFGNDPVRLTPSPRRGEFLKVVRRRTGLSLSKILNTGGYKLGDLRYVRGA